MSVRRVDVSFGARCHRELRRNEEFPFRCPDWIGAVRVSLEAREQVP